MHAPRLFPVFALLLAACSAPTFTAEVKGEATVPGSTLGGLLDVFPAIGSFASLDFNENQDFKNQGVTKDQVRSATLKHVRLQILAPAEQDFSFLDRLEFYARAGNQQEVLVAERQDIASLGLKAPNPVLEMSLKGVELQPYITAPSMSLTVRGRGRQPSREVRLQASVAVEVQVGLGL
jgi:hypothetical protein